MPNFIKTETTYTVKVRTETETSEKEGGWSKEAEFTPEFSEYCAWKECPDDIYEDRKYSVDKMNPRIATKVQMIIVLCTAQS